MPYFVFFHKAWHLSNAKLCFLNLARLQINVKIAFLKLRRMNFGEITIRKDNLWQDLAQVETYTCRHPVSF